jgi:hypothetical protein
LSSWNFENSWLFTHTKKDGERMDHEAFVLQMQSGLAEPFHLGRLAALT